MPDRQPAPGIAELGERDPGHRGHLRRVGGRHRDRPPPPGQDGGDGKPAPGDEQLRQHREDLNPGGVHARLLGRLPERGGDRGPRRPRRSRHRGTPAARNARRSPGPRCTSSRSGPSGPMPKSTSTAEGRPPPGGGRRGDGTAASPAATARSRSQRGGPRVPPMLSTGSAALTRTGPSSPARGPSSHPWDLSRRTGTAGRPRRLRRRACGRGRRACRARSAGATGWSTRTGG